MGVISISEHWCSRKWWLGGHVTHRCFFREEVLVGLECNHVKGVDEESERNFSLGLG